MINVKQGVKINDADEGKMCKESECDGALKIDSGLLWTCFDSKSSVMMS